MKEVNYDEKIQFVLTYQDDLWTKILPKGLEDTNWVDIATYNFNFQDTRDKSFYLKLREFANKGFEIRLIFSKPYKNEIKLDEFFSKSVYCVYNENNHAKIFLTENLGYIGSANFSLGSNNNYECGVLIKDKLLIKQIRQSIFLKLLDGRAINTPYPDFLLYKINYLISESTKILNILDDTDFGDRMLILKVIPEIKLDNYYILWQPEYQNVLYQLGFESSEIDELRNKFNLYFVENNYDYFGFPSRIHDVSVAVSEKECVRFHDYLRNLNKFCINAKNEIERAYANLGRENYMDDLECNINSDDNLD